MKFKFNLSLFLVVFVLVTACKPDEEFQKITIAKISPGNTISGSNSLNTAMIGDTMTITGENFSLVVSENHVSVHGVPAVVMEASTSVIKAKVPPGVPFSLVNVVVARPGYQEAVSAISIKKTPSPVITGISPVSGPVGTVVTIYGKNLKETLEANIITFADQAGKPELIIRPFNPVTITPEFIRVIIPAGAGSGAISLYAKPYQNVDNSFFNLVTPTFTVTP